jgi:hypothetical protein
MGDEVALRAYTREERRRYRKRVRECLDVFEQMLAHSSFDFEKPLTGLEIELNLVGSDFNPAMANATVLDVIADPGFQTELGQYNIELNVSPRPLSGNNSLELEEMLRKSLNHAEAQANAPGGTPLPWRNATVRTSTSCRCCPIGARCCATR